MRSRSKRFFWDTLFPLSKEAQKVLDYLQRVGPTTDFELRVMFGGRVFDHIHALCQKGKVSVSRKDPYDIYELAV